MTTTATTTATTTVQNPILRRLYENETIFVGEMEVAVHEQVADATCEAMFHSLSKNLDVLCFSQAQIVKFCQENPEKLCLHGFGLGQQATIFLFKGNGDFFVVRVGCPSLGGHTADHTGLHAKTYPLKNKRKWFASLANRLVAPQLKP